jgi:hypothetical protein
MVNQPDPRVAPSVQSQEAVNPGGEDAIGQGGWISGESQQTYSVDSAGN